MEILILSGGGAKGSFQAGVLYQLFDNFKFKEMKGTSVGGINAVILAQCYLDGKPDLLKKMWNEIIQDSKDVYKTNYFRSLFLRQPYSFAPLEEIIDKYIDIKSIQKMPLEISLTTTDLITGNSVYINSKTSTAEEFKRGIIASSTMPPAFPPVEIKDYYLVDGGLRENVPMRNILSKNRKEGILVIVTSPVTIKAVGRKKDLNLISVGTRAIEIMMNEITTNDINGVISTKETQIKDKKKEIANIDIIAPYSNLFDSALDFDKDTMRKSFNDGISRAKTYMKDVWGQKDKFYIKDI